MVVRAVASVGVVVLVVQPVAAQVWLPVSVLGFGNRVQTSRLEAWQPVGSEQLPGGRLADSGHRGKPDVDLLPDPCGFDRQHRSIVALLLGSLPR